MASLRKSHVWLIITLTLLIVLPIFTQAITSYSSTEIHTATQPSVVNGIVLEANKPDIFNWYNTNGAPPYMSGNSAVFYGSNRTNMYSDIVSLTSINANKSLVLEASVSTSIKNLSNTGEDQFAVFATDDTTKYKSDEFGFVLPETGNTWYAYVQSPQIPGFFVWKPLLTLKPSGVEQHSFKAVYSNVGLLQFVDFYVDGKLLCRALYPNISGQNFHMVLSSHKVSAENIDISQNAMEIGKACLSDSLENDSQEFSYFSLL